MSKIESPCILVCAIDPVSGYCFGCGRTRQEIAGWMKFSHDERRSIMDGLSARLETVERKPRRITRRQQIAKDRGQELQRLVKFSAAPSSGEPTES